MSEGATQLESYHLTSWLVDPSNAISGEGQSPQMERWQRPFHQVALDALRHVAAQEGHLSLEGWAPNPEQAAALYRGLAYERKLHSMIGGLKTYVAEQPEGSAISMFRNNQQEMADTLAETFDGMSLSEPIRLKSPTSSGKTGVIVGLTEGLKSQEDPHDETGVLILTPRKEILLQTIDAFKMFGNKIKPTKYFGDHKELSKVTVMTYQSFQIAYRAGIITREMFNAIIRDESHNARGKNIQKELHDFCYGSEGEKHTAVFDLSATPRVETHELHYDKNLVQGLEEGIVSPVSARYVYTQSYIGDMENRTVKGDQDFAFAELQNLIDDKARNEIVINEILSGIRNGKRTLVRCIPGGDLRHAQILSDMLTARGRVRIMNPHMGDREFRKANSFIIRGNMPIGLRRRISDVFTHNLNWDIDALFFVETLTQGWDSPIAKKIINASPTRSEWTIEQVFGRITRHFQRMNGEVVTGEAVDIIDNSASGQVSFTSILDRDAPSGMRYREGVVIGPGLADYYNSPNLPHSAFEPVPQKR